MREFSYKNILLYTILIIANSVTHEKISGLFISLPQIVIVVFLLLKGKTDKAFLLHLVFTITCLAIPFSQIINPEESQYGLFNYSKLKLLGPVGVFHIIMLGFFMRTIRFKIKIPRNSIFYSLYKTIIFLGISGILVGIFGLVFLDYYLEYFILYTSYILTLFFTAFVLIRMSFCFNLHKMLLEVLISAPIAAFLVFLLGFSSKYGGENISILIEVVYFSMALIFAYYHLKSYLLPLISFFFTSFFLLDGGMGGKGIIFMVCVLLIFLITSFNKNTTGINIQSRKRILRFAMVPLLSFSVFKFVSYIENSEYNLFLYKLENVTLLVNVFSGFNGLSLIPESPRVRIIEVLNIFRELLSNPFFLFFGKGYGSYFSDSYGLLGGADLINAYKAVEIRSDKYGGVHDSFSSIPLANGIIGLYLVFRLVIKYFKMIKHNFMAYSAIPWLAFTFYYNVQFGIVAMLLLFSAEFYSKNLSEYEK